MYIGSLFLDGSTCRPLRLILKETFFWASNDKLIANAIEKTPQNEFIAVIEGGSGRPQTGLNVLFLPLRTLHFAEKWCTDRWKATTEVSVTVIGCLRHSVGE